MKLREIGESDQRIMGVTRKKGNFLIFEHPDLEAPLKAQVPEKMDAGVITSWCNFVRGHINERTDSEKIAQSNARRVSEKAPAEVVADTKGSGGVRPPVEPAVQGPQADLESRLKAEIAVTAARAKDAASRWSDFEDRARHAQREFQQYTDELRTLERIVGELASASKVRKADSPAGDAKEVRAGRKARPRRRVAGPAVPRPDEG